MLTADPRPYEGHSTRNQHWQEEYHADPMESCGFCGEGRAGGTGWGSTNPMLA